MSQSDPAFRDHILFHEYFHGDTGRGLGASHQTGWTGCVALLLAGPDSAWAKTTGKAASPAPSAVKWGLGRRYDCASGLTIRRRDRLRPFRPSPDRSD